MMRTNILLLVLLTLAACNAKPNSNTSQAKVTEGGTLRLPIELSQQQFSQLNWDLSNPKLRALSQLVEGRMIHTDDSTLINSGIEAATEDGGRTWKLRGSANRSVQANWFIRWRTILRGPNCPLRSQLRDLVVGAEDYALGKSDEISGVDYGSDDVYVMVTLTRPFPTFPDWANQPGLGDAELPGREFARSGYGPFYLDSQSEGTAALTLLRTDLREKHTRDLPVAHLESVSLVFEPDRHKQFELYKAGQLDTCNLTPEDLSAVLADPELKKQLHTYDTAATLVGFIDLHAAPWGNAPFKDKTPLRQAVNWAVYRNELAENSGGMFEPWPHFMPKALKQYIDPAALATPLYNVEPDLDKAKEGEALAGHDQASLLPTNMLLSYVEDPFLGQLAEGIRENFDEISIRMRPYPCKTQADALQLVKIGSMDIWLQWVYPAYQSPDALFYPTLYSKLEGLGGNYGRCNEKEIDTLIEQAQAEPDEAARTKLYQQLENEVEKRALFLMLGSGKANILINPKLAGYELTPYDFDASLPAQDFAKLGFTSL